MAKKKEAAVKEPKAEAAPKATKPAKKASAKKPKTDPAAKTKPAAEAKKAPAKKAAKPKAKKAEPAPVAASATAKPAKKKPAAKKKVEAGDSAEVDGIRSRLQGLLSEVESLTAGLKQQVSEATTVYQAEHAIFKQALAQVLAEARAEAEKAKQPQPAPASQPDTLQPEPAGPERGVMVAETDKVEGPEPALNGQG